MVAADSSGYNASPGEPNPVSTFSLERMRAGRSTYRFSKSGEDAVSVPTRNLFLHALEKRAPEVLRDLYAEVLPAYLAARPLAPDLTWRNLSSQGQSETGLALSRSLHAWATRFHLHADWFLDVALKTLELHLRQERAHWVHIPDRLVKAISAEDQRFTYEHAGWDATEISRSAVTAVIRADFAKKLQAYLDGQEAAVLQKRGVPLVERRGTALKNHIDWFVKWNVKGWTKADIQRGRQVPTSDTSNARKKKAKPQDYRRITRGIQDASGAIGIPPRVVKLSWGHEKSE